MKAEALAMIDTLNAASLPTVIFAVVFIGCVWLAWSPSQREKQNAMANLPLADDEKGGR